MTKALGKAAPRGLYFATAIVGALSLLSVGAQAKCTQVFSALSIAGTQYSAAHGFVAPKVVSGTIALNLRFENSGNLKYSVAGVSLQYTLDDQPISPVLTDNFAWNWNTVGVAEGTHVLSVLYVNEPSPLVSPCFSFLPREYSVVVENTGVPITGAQMVPITGRLQLYISPVVPQIADWVMFPGAQPHATAHPYPYQFIAPAGGVPPAAWYSEPLVTQISAEGEGSPSFYSLANGSIISDGFYVEHSAYDDSSYPYIARQGGYDGPRDDNSVSPYAAYVPNLDGPGFFGLSIDGRLFQLNMDGSVQTLAGWVTRRDVVPFYDDDPTIPMSTLYAQQETLIGNFDVPFKDPLDLAIDPNNHNVMYVADNGNNRIAKVDFSVSPPVISTFAGVTGQKGYLDGPANTALFNGPSSIVIEADGTMYVSDANNNVIRKIDSTGVSTLVGIGYPGSATPEPSMNTVAASPLTYAPRTAVPFSQAYINNPLPIRLDSKGNIVELEPVTRTVRYIDLSAQTVTTLAQLSVNGIAAGPWDWLDVDRWGNVGTQDDILVAEAIGNAGNESVFRIPITGTAQIPPPLAIKESKGTPLHNGLACCLQDEFTEYPWAIAIDDQEGCFISAGFGTFGIASFRILQPSDPPFVFNLADFAAGKQIWNTGTVPNFPFGSRPSFAAVHGFEGHSMLGSVMNFDDMVSMSDAALATYLQNGAEGSVPRPELTGNDLRNVIYFIRRTATGGDTVQPGPSSTDTTAPIISNVAAAEVDSTTVSVTWQTDKSTLGVVSWGTTTGAYFGWSPIEPGYATSHSVTLPNLPALQTIHFIVRSKDQAGNQTATADQTITLN